MQHGVLEQFVSLSGTRKGVKVDMQHGESTQTMAKHTKALAKRVAIPLCWLAGDRAG